MIAPALGGMIAAGTLWVFNDRIVRQADRIAAAKRWLPIMMGAMAGAFAAFLAIKGLGRLVDIALPQALAIGGVAGLLAWGGSVPLIARQARGLENRTRALKPLLTVPLVLSAALLSFAHGASDVSNAIGPVAAVVDAVRQGAAPEMTHAPVWVMLIGALGISLGLFLFGPRLVRLVGERITRLNPIRAFCVAISAAATVLAAAGLGLPVSSTHVAVGAVFGVGFYREWEAARHGRAAPPMADVTEGRRRRLVRRSHFLTMVAAWVITAPAAGALSAATFALASMAAR
jgi:PiT family inorganic phosphate transporter